MFTYRDFLDQNSDKQIYLNEENDTNNSGVRQLLNLLANSSQDDITTFGNYLYINFFTDDNANLSKYEPEDFCLTDILYFLSQIDDEDIFINLSQEFMKIVDNDDYTTQFPYDYDDYQDSDLSEGVHAFNIKNANKKVRKFFTLSKADLLRMKPKNKIKNREERAKKRSYRRANATKIKRYQQLIKRAIDKGLHHVKLRRKV